MSESYDLAVRRDDLRETTILAAPAEHEIELAPGEALLRIELFAITANTVTYGAMGDALRYWQFFPAPDDLGRIPAWGFAEVLRSEAEAAPAGARVYGYLPMSTHLVVEAGDDGGTGFVDLAAHRADLPAVYNRYGFVTAESEEERAREPYVALFAPLFTTSFMLADQLEEEGFHGAERALISSASSKTALALAHLLRSGHGDRIDLVGLTSAANLPFVTGTGLYDDVLPYEALPELDSGRPTAYLDFGGNADQRQLVHELLGPALTHSAVIGAADWEHLAPSDETAVLPGPRPEFFFAPTRVAKRNQDWGAAELRRRASAAQAEFIEASRAWMTIRRDSGPEALRSTLLDFLDGRVDPSEGWAIEP